LQGQRFRTLLNPSPRQELVEFLDGPAIDELGEDIGQIGLRVDAVKLGGLDQRCEAGPVDSTVVVAGEQAIFSIQRNLAVILPISGRMSVYIIAGIRCTGKARGANTRNGVKSSGASG
jgi:hypothetical protein